MDRGKEYITCHLGHTYGPDQIHEASLAPRSCQHFWGLDNRVSTSQSEGGVLITAACVAFVGTAEGRPEAEQTLTLIDIDMLHQVLLHP